MRAALPLVPALAASLAAHPVGAQTAEIKARAIAEYTSEPRILDVCLTNGTTCMADAHYVFGNQGEAHGSAAYNEILFGSQVRASALSWGTGAPGGPPFEVRSFAEVGARVVWRGSGALPAGTPIGVRVILPFTGRLGLVTPQVGCLAEVRATLQVEGEPFGSAVLFDAEATMEGTGSGHTFTESGDWSGDFVPVPMVAVGPFFGTGYDVDSFDVVAFDTFMSEYFVILFILDTRAELPAPAELAAVADFSNTGQYTLEAFDPATGQTLSGVSFESFACYADCDASSGIFVLDIFDFLCFQDLFIQSEPYACDCDTGTGPGTCDVFDFLCFQDAFVSGCP